jgi:hypothetical protein
MHYLLESVFVGLYSWIIYKIVHPFATSSSLFFLVGFVKHFVGYWVGLHAYYCQYGDACTVYRVSPNPSLFVGSLFEGTAYAILGTLLVIHSKDVLFFLIGILLHLLAEWTSVHTEFCKRCLIRDI